jgi:hypothetical protein
MYLCPVLFAHVHRTRKYSSLFCAEAKRGEDKRRETVLVLASVESKSQLAIYALPPELSLAGFSNSSLCIEVTSEEQGGSRETARGS